ncbi:hypothetical protein [Pseudotamlana agarivorans]
MVLSVFVHEVVTEYGVANLFGKTIKEARKSFSVYGSSQS